MKGSAAGSRGAFLLPDKLNGAKKRITYQKILEPAIGTRIDVTCHIYQD